MFRYLKLNNVRLFSNRNSEFDLPKLTVFCGTNSCGKSTILKTLLLLRQSQGLSESYGVRPGRLRFTGSQVDLGNYKSFVFHNNVDNKIQISLEIIDRMPKEWIYDLRKTDIGNSYVSRPMSGYSPYTLKIDFTFFASSKPIETDEVGQVKTISPEGILESSRWTISVEDQVISSWEIKLKNSNQPKYEYQIIVSKDLLIKPSSELSKLMKSTRNKYIVLDVELEGLICSRVIQKNLDRSGNIELPLYIYEAMYDFVVALRQINYIAPLRSAAKRYYLANYDLTTDLDPKGEFLPYILGGIIEEPDVVDVLPKTKTIKKHKLSEALNNWLYYLRTGEKLKVNKKNEFEASSHKSALVEISIRGIAGSTTYPLADSGFGYSQVLPIIVRGLIARSGSTIIVEQPELHLNPSLQVRLSDFFIAMTYAKKQIIIETHSEHIVNAIRVSTAKDFKGELSKNTNIYFIDLNRGKPVIHNMKIKKNGTVPDWPVNFFGEAANLAGELLRIQKQHKILNS